MSATVRSFERSTALLQRAYEVTSSPRTDLEGRYPLVIASGSGAEVTDLDGNRYLDLTSSFGSVLVGHAEPAVAEAVATAAFEGNLFYTGASTRRLALAEVLLGWFPWADRALFFKTGSCAVSAAVRLAQHATGRQGVLTSGYHGWHDWHLEALPEFRLFPSYAQEISDDVELCERLMRDSSGSIAALVVSPTPSLHGPGHYRRLGDLARRYGVKFIVDEVKTAIRAGRGGYSAQAGLTPDAVTASKGLANGHSISAVVGLNDIMLAHERAHVWNTYQNEQTSFAAALATMRIVDELDVPGVVAKAGEALAGRVRDTFTAAGVPVKVHSWGPSFQLEPTAPGDLGDRLQAALLDNGLFCDVEDDFNISYRSASRIDEMASRFESAVRGVAA
jgi:glutamate-1-semialdehyde aminotransferase